MQANSDMFRPGILSMRRGRRALACLPILGLLIGGPLAATDPAGRIGVIVEKKVPGRLYVAYRHEISSLAEVYPIERRATRKMNDLFRHHPGVRFGPVEYHIDFGFGGDRAMTLGVATAVPVGALEAIDPRKEGLAVVETGEFHCLSILYRGSPIDLEQPWARLAEAVAGGAVATGFNREIIIDHGGYIAADYLTELQLGIAD